MSQEFKTALQKFFDERLTPGLSYCPLIPPSYRYKVGDEELKVMYQDGTACSGCYAFCYVFQKKDKTYIVLIDCGHSRSHGGEMKEHIEVEECKDLVEVYKTLVNYSCDPNNSADAVRYAKAFRFERGLEDTDVEIEDLIKEEVDLMKAFVEIPCFHTWEDYIDEETGILTVMTSNEERKSKDLKVELKRFFDRHLVADKHYIPLIPSSYKFIFAGEELKLVYQDGQNSREDYGFSYIFQKKDESYVIISEQGKVKNKERKPRNLSITECKDLVEVWKFLAEDYKISADLLDYAMFARVQRKIKGKVDIETLIKEEIDIIKAISMLRQIVYNTRKDYLGEESLILKVMASKEEKKPNHFNLKVNVDKLLEETEEEDIDKWLAGIANTLKK